MNWEPAQVSKVPDDDDVALMFKDFVPMPGHPGILKIHIAKW